MSDQMSRLHTTLNAQASSIILKNSDKTESKSKTSKLKKKIKILQSKLSGYKFYDDVISEYSALAYPRIVE